MEKENILKETNLKEANPKEIEEYKLIEQTKKISTKEAAAYSLMDGFGFRYISPYALAVGATNTQIGLLSSLPSLFGNLSQLLTYKAMKIWSRKKIVFIAVLLQALMWLAIIAAGSLYFIFNIKNQFPGYSVIIIYTLLILMGAFGGPAWVSWMKDIVKKDSGKYFGNRSRIATSISLCCTFIAGFILDYFKGTKIFIGFIIIFFLSFIGRSFSAYYTTKQYEPKIIIEDKFYFSLKDFIKRMHKNNFGKFVIYFSLVSFAVNISAPFLAVYMLKELQFSYTYFMAVTLASVLTTLIFVGLWGKFADRYGNLKVMQITGALIPLMPFLWLISAIIDYKPLIWIFLLLVESFSGMVWAGFNLSAGNFIYDAVTRQRIGLCTSYFNIINGLGVLIGAMLGGWISSQNFVFLGLKPILFIFLLGATLRITVYLTMNKRIKEVREIENFSVRHHIKEVTKKLINGKSTGKFFNSIGTENTS